MLNELYSLAEVLEDTEIPTERWSDSARELRKVTVQAPCLRIWLSDDSTVSNIDRIGSELATVLRKFGDNQKSFPALNIAPLYRLVDPDQIAELERMEKKTQLFDLEKVRSWCVQSNWTSGLNNKVKRCLDAYPQELLKRIGVRKEQEYLLLAELVRLSERLAEESGSKFRKTLEKYIFEKLQTEDERDLMLHLLFHKGSAAKKSDQDTGSLSIILDLEDWQTYGEPVSSKHMTHWINWRLVESEQKGKSNVLQSNEADAFGAPFVPVYEKMPIVKIAGIDTILRSMFDAHYCQHRYRKIENGSYPIAESNRARTKAALEWIGAAEQKNVMWEIIDQKEILFVFPSKLPKIMPKFATLFGSGQTADPALSKARFESIAEEFIKVCKGTPVEQKPELMRIFTIRKIDKGRSKVNFTYNCTPEWLMCAAQEWQVACRNLPDFDFCEGVTPFPLQVPHIVNRVWKQDGNLAQGKTGIERLKLYQGMELLLKKLPKTSICTYLHVLVTNASGLVGFLGNFMHGAYLYKDKKEEKKLDNPRQEMAQILAIMGLLLYKHGNRKEKYMENLAYLMGQMLKISDEMHAMYCKVVRGEKGVPTQLVGSALFVAACDRPVQALAQMSVRMNPYITWAKQYRTQKIGEEGKESWRAGWYLMLYENIADRLRPLVTDTVRFDDLAKAQLFIGYLASFPKKTADKPENSKDLIAEVGGKNNV